MILNNKLYIFFKKIYNIEDDISMMIQKKQFIIYVTKIIF